VKAERSGWGGLCLPPSTTKVFPHFLLLLVRSLALSLALSLTLSFKDFFVKEEVGVVTTPVGVVAVAVAVAAVVVEGEGEGEEEEEEEEEDQPRP